MSAGCPVCTLTARLGVTPNGARLLAALSVADPGAWTSRRALEAALGYAPTARTHTVETHTWRIRQVFGDDAVECLPRVGYRLSADMRQRCEDALHGRHRSDRH